MSPSNQRAGATFLTGRPMLGLGLSGLCVFGLCLLALAPTEATAYNVYYANLHSHSNFSDGIGTPQEAYAYARDVADIDVLALTDHTGYMNQTEYSQLLAIADQYTQTGVFVALAAQESGNLNDFGHINIYDCVIRNPNPTYNLPANYNFIETQGAVGCFNHPTYGSNFENLTFYSEYADAMRAIEIRNGERSTGYEPQFLQALANGWKVGPFAGQDNHNGHWGDDPDANMGNKIFLTGILANSLTKTEILGALHARRFFAMEVNPPSDRMELNFTADGQPMGSVTVVGANPLFLCDAHTINGVSLFNRVDLFRDGVLYNTQILIGHEIHYEFRDLLADGESHYYFVRANQVDSDQCWSAPIWVTAQIDPASVAEALPNRGPLLTSPNPAASGTVARWALPEGEVGWSDLIVLDPAGRLVRLLRAGGEDGNSAWMWDGSDRSGRPVVPGVYYWRVSGPHGSGRSGRLVRLR